MGMPLPKCLIAFSCIPDHCKPVIAALTLKYKRKYITRCSFFDGAGIIQVCGTAAMLLFQSVTYT